MRLRSRMLLSSTAAADTTTITARTTEALPRFDLDFFLHVTSLKINGTPATFGSKPNGELVVTTAAALAKGAAVTIVVVYSDIPSNPLPAQWCQLLERHFRRCPGRQRAAHRPVVVPRQRPPVGQGDLRRVGRRTCRGGGAVQRCPARQAGPTPTPRSASPWKIRPGRSTTAASGAAGPTPTWSPTRTPTSGSVTRLSRRMPCWAPGVTGRGWRRCRGRVGAGSRRGCPPRCWSCPTTRDAARRRRSRGPRSRRSRSPR